MLAQLSYLLPRKKHVFDEDALSRYHVCCPWLSRDGECPCRCSLLFRGTHLKNQYYHHPHHRTRQDEAQPYRDLPIC